MSYLNKGQWKIKLLNRKIEMENEVTENEIKNEIKVQTKYWHECWHYSCWHKWNKMKLLNGKTKTEN